MVVFYIVSGYKHAISEVMVMQVKDMTQGSAVKHIVMFAVPLFIGNIFQQVYNLVDTMIAGYNLGDEAIAAIGATSTLFSLIMSFANGLNTGYAIVVTQYFGAHDDEKFKCSTAALFLLNIAISVLVAGMTLLSLKPLMHFLNVPEDIFRSAYTYISIIFAGLPATMGYNMFAGYLRAVGNSRTPLYFLIISSILNILMDMLFIMGLKTGVEGAALATVAAQMFSVILCGIYTWKKYSPILPGKRHYRPEKVLYTKMLSSGFAMAVMNCIFGIGSVIMQRSINALSAVVITAHTSARRLLEMMLQPLGSFSSAISTFVGQNWGAGKTKRIEAAIRKVTAIEIGWGLFAAVIIFLFGENLIVLMTGTGDPEVIKNAVMNLRINFVFFPILGILLCLRMSMQAMGQKIPPLFSSSLELIMKLLAAFFVVPRYGYVGASFTEPLSWLFCSILLGVIYLCTKKKAFAKGFEG